MRWRGRDAGGAVARGLASRRSCRWLAAYGEARNVPDQDATSRLSPYLHWGHIGAHEVFQSVMAREGWLGHVPRKATGAREGWWGVSPAAEGFLDELVTWRELGFNLTSTTADYASSTPCRWARRSLDAHAPTFARTSTTSRRSSAPPPRSAVERRPDRAGARGPHPQHLRMLWGKKILEWSASPREALAVMIELNNKYTRRTDPNSYTGSRGSSAGSIGVGTGTAHLRGHPLHEFREHGAQGPGARVLRRYGGEARLL